MPADGKQTTDPGVLADAVAGDPQAFGQLVNQFQNLILSMAYSALGDLHRSEETAQLVFVTAWNRRETLQDPQKFAAWLRGIARNVIRSEQRAVQRSAKRSAEVVEVAAGTASPEQQTINREQREFLWGALEKLPESCRETLVLYYRESKSAEDVASLLGVSEDVVRQRLVRGRQLLNQRLAGLVEELLEESRPTPQFALAVVAALPTAQSAAAASGALKTVVAAAGKGAGAGGLLGLLGTLLGVLGGFFGAFVGTWRSLQQAESGEERRFILRMTAGLTLFIGSFLLALLVGIPRIEDGELRRGAQTLVWCVYTPGLGYAIRRINLRLTEIRAGHGSVFDQQMIRQADTPQTVAQLRWMVIGTAMGSTAMIPVCAAMAGDWIVLITLLLLVAGAVRWTWIQSAACDSLIQQRQLSIRVITACGTVAALVLFFRWDVWREQPMFDEASRVPGWMLSLAVLLCVAVVVATLRLRQVPLPQNEDGSAEK